MLAKIKIKIIWWKPNTLRTHIYIDHMAYYNKNKEIIKINIRAHDDFIDGLCKANKKKLKNKTNLKTFLWSLRSKMKKETKTKTLKPPHFIKKSLA